MFLKDSILPGTEVRIVQEGGKLLIQMTTDSAKSHDLLSAHQSSLQSQLNERLKDRDVVVDVQMGAGQEGDHHDGRSRQQRDIIDETEEDREK